MFSCVKVGSNEIVINKSRFLAYSRLVESRDEAKAFAETLRKDHPEARHVCYAFIADESGDAFGYDDDGEPSGTAGKPIYSALAASGARKSVIAVVRYFGGIKLGAGGLTRAYRQSAAELIEKVGLAHAQKFIEYCVECDGETYKKIARAMHGANIVIENIVYASGVKFTALAPSGDDLSVRLAAFGVTPRAAGERYVFTEN